MRAESKLKAAAKRKRRHGGYGRYRKGRDCTERGAEITKEYLSPAMKTGGGKSSPRSAGLLFQWGKTKKKKEKERKKKKKGA
jgi:hypothetical protein